MDVLLIGEAMGLFIAEEYGDFEEIQNFSKGIAGAEINVAIGLSRLDYDVSYISKLGTDPVGDYIKKYLEMENIDTQHMIEDRKNTTGLQIKNKVINDDPKVAYYRKDSAFSTLNKKEVDLIDFSEIRLLHVTGIPLALTESTRETLFYLVKKAQKNNSMITFDPNLRVSLWENEETMIQTVNEMATYVDVIMPGIAEGIALTGKQTAEEIADFYLNLGVGTVIIKDGSKGAFFKEKNKEIQFISGMKVEEVVDTVGAGDGFAAGVISGILEAVSIGESVRRGNAVGSLQVQHKSDNEALPTRDELLFYMKDY